MYEYKPGHSCRQMAVKLRTCNLQISNCLEKSYSAAVTAVIEVLCEDYYTSW